MPPKNLRNVRSSSQKPDPSSSGVSPPAQITAVSSATASGTQSGHKPDTVVGDLSSIQESNDDTNAEHDGSQLSDENDEDELESLRAEAANTRGKTTEELEAIFRRITILQSLRGVNHPQSAVPSPAIIHDRSDREDRHERSYRQLLKSNAPSLSGNPTLDQFEAWTEQVDNEFEMAGCHEDTTRRSRWVIKGIKHKDATKRLMKRIKNSSDSNPLGWTELKKLTLDAIKDPATREFEQMKNFYEARMRPSQSLRSFVSHVEGIADLMDPHPFRDASLNELTGYKIQYFFPRFPKKVQEQLQRDCAGKKKPQHEIFEDFEHWLDQAVSHEDILNAVDKSNTTENANAQQGKHTRSESSTATDKQPRKRHRSKNSGSAPSSSSNTADGKSNSQQNTGPSHAERKDNARQDNSQNKPWRNRNDKKDKDKKDSEKAQP
jgi:hypothetical protein